MKTYLTKTIPDVTGGFMSIVYYVCPHIGHCHVAYYKADGSAA